MSKTLNLTEKLELSDNIQQQKTVTDQITDAETRLGQALEDDKTTIQDEIDILQTDLNDLEVQERAMYPVVSAPITVSTPSTSALSSSAQLLPPANIASTSSQPGTQATTPPPSILQAPVQVASLPHTQAQGSSSQSQPATQVSQHFFKSIPKPDKYQKGQNFSRFIKRFVSYATLSNMKEENLDLLFLSFIDHDETYEKLARIELSPHQKRDIASLMEKFEDAIYPTSSAQTLKSELQNLTQKSDESAEEFAFRISDISDKAYSNLAVRNESALATFIRGCNDSGIKAKILDAEVTSFDEAIKVAVKWEKINAVISPVQEHDSALYRIQDRQPNSYRGQQTGQQHVSYRDMHDDRRPDVTYRDDNGHYRFDRQRRPLQCWYCSEIGHRRSVCPRRQYPNQQTRDNNYNHVQQTPVSNHGQQTPVSNHVQQTPVSNTNNQSLNSNQAGGQAEAASRNIHQ